MFRHSGEADDGAMVEPLPPVGHVRHDFRDRMRKAVRFRVRLVGGEAVKDRARLEQHLADVAAAVQLAESVGVRAFATAYDRSCRLCSFSWVTSHADS